MYYIQWNQLCIMDTLGPLISVQIIKGVLFSRSDKASFGTITKYVDYAGVLISSALRLTGFTVAILLSTKLQLST